MPNWTTNYVNVNGPATEVQRFVEHVRSDEQAFDFNKVIPMPEEFIEIYNGNCVIDGKSCQYWRMIEDDTGKKKQVAVSEEEINTAIAKYGCFGGYNWCLANWGTKWNAHEVQCDASEIALTGEYGWATYQFDTAWCAPEKIAKKLRKLYPTLEIRWEYKDEDFAYPEI